MTARISELSRRLLWSRSAGRCAYTGCRKELVPLHPGSQKAANTGDEAHIVGESRQAARGVSKLSEIERADYSNLILLCPNHHRRIDNKVFRQDYSVARLHEMKTHLELWVQESLSGPTPIEDAADRIYAKLIDDAVTKCHLETWNAWSDGTVSVRPLWRRSHIEGILEFRDELLAAVFYDTRPELQAALTRFAHVIAGAALAFDAHSDDTANGWARADQFYRKERFLKYVEPRAALRAVYDRWQADCYSRMHEAMAAAN